MKDLDILVDELEKSLSQPFIHVSLKENFIIYFRPILDQIQDSNNRKKATLELMITVIELQKNNILRDIEKELNYVSYTDKPEREINKRIKATEIIEESLEYANTKEAKDLKKLLKLYKEQTEKLRNQEYDNIFWSKSYKYPPKVIKKSLKTKIEQIIKRYNLKVTQYMIKDAIDNTLLSLL